MFYVRCYTGNPTHVMEVVPGSELEDKCKTRATNGYIDALPLGPDDCPNCVADRRDRERRYADSFWDFCCPAAMSNPDHECTHACADMMAPKPIENSPYQDQLRGIGPVNVG
jgi:hypothetical protein